MSLAYLYHTQQNRYGEVNALLTFPKMKQNFRLVGKIGPLKIITYEHIQ